MPKIQGKFCIIVVGLLLVSAASAQDAATREFIDASNRMVGPDIDTGHLLLFLSKMATWGSRDDDAGEVPNLSNYGMDWQFPLPQIPVSKIFPYARLRPLMYCSNCKISSLTFQNNISPSANSVFGS